MKTSVAESFLIVGCLLACARLVVGETDCESLCTATDNVPWDPVRNESAYDRDPNSISDINGRPLGFSFETLEYNDNQDPRTPCVTVTGCQDRRLEIMVETDPPAMICVEDVSTQPAQSRNMICQEVIYVCGQCPLSADGSVTFQFSCQGQSCDQSAVNFWYRFVVSEEDQVIDPELWCDARDSGQTPLSLIEINIPAPPQPTEKGTGRGTSLAATLPAIILSLLMFILGMH